MTKTRSYFSTSFESMFVILSPLEYLNIIRDTAVQRIGMESPNDMNDRG
jgi:hypothetical protein